jgi:hypothetical protein
MELFNCPLLNVAQIGINKLSVVDNAISLFLLPLSCCIGKTCRFSLPIPTLHQGFISEAQRYCSLLTAWYVLNPSIETLIAGVPIKYLDTQLREINESILL